MREFELVRWNVLRRDNFCLGPIAGQRMGERKVLADGRVRTLLASRCLEHRNRLVRMTGERKRETVVGGVEDRPARLQELKRLIPLAECRFH